MKPRLVSDTFTHCVLHVLQVVNLYGISFVDDSHVDLLSSTCIHLEVLAMNFCLRVKGASLRTLIQRCKKLKTLLMQHCGESTQTLCLQTLQRQSIHNLLLRCS